jgi:hypothetical protein
MNADVVERHVRLDEGDDPGVVACNGPVAQCGAGEAADLAGSALAHAALGNEGLNDHLTTLRGQSLGQRRP